MLILLIFFAFFAHFVNYFGKFFYFVFFSVYFIDFILHLCSFDWFSFWFIILLFFGVLIFVLLFILVILKDGFYKHLEKCPIHRSPSAPNPLSNFMKKQNLIHLLYFNSEKTKCEHIHKRTTLMWMDLSLLEVI